MKKVRLKEKIDRSFRDIRICGWRAGNCRYYDRFARGFSKSSTKSRSKRVGVRLGIRMCVGKGVAGVEQRKKIGRKKNNRHFMLLRVLFYQIFSLSFSPFLCCRIFLQFFFFSLFCFFSFFPLKATMKPNS